MKKHWAFVKRTEPDLWAEFDRIETSPVDLGDARSKPHNYEKTWEWTFRFGLPTLWGWPTIYTKRVDNRVLLVLGVPDYFARYNSRFSCATHNGLRVLHGGMAYVIIGVCQHEEIVGILEYNADVWWHNEIMIPGAEGQVDCLWRDKRPKLKVSDMKIGYYKPAVF